MDVLLKIVFGILIFVFSIIFIIFIIFLFYLIKYKKQYNFKIIEQIGKDYKVSIFYRIFLQLPRQLALDRLTRNPNEFQEFGLHLFCGEQGSGKTTAVVDMILNKWLPRYPKLKVYTNFSLNVANGEINHWSDLLREDRNNGIYGVVNVIDEISSWFSSLQSKDFPPEMLSEISMQRKQRKVIVGTAQVFGRVAKPIREQTLYVYLPKTFLGCFTIVRVSKPIYYDEETFEFKRYIKTYFFVHTPLLRNSFDTYEKVKKMAKQGFKSDLERNNNNLSV